MFNGITTADLATLISTGELGLVDLRSTEAYNGWVQPGERRGGHIRTARCLPAAWAEYLDWPEIIEAKGLRQDLPLVLYGSEERLEPVAALFQRLGFEDVRLYRDFASRWTTDPSLPMDRLSRFRHLVSATWLDRLLRTGTAPEHDGRPVVVCHAHYRNPADYAAGHIPGAVALDTNALESPETWNRRSPEEVLAVLTSLGITRDTTVVLYGRFDTPRNEDLFPGSAAGHLGAMRCAFIMLWAGVEDVRVLNGGLLVWQSAGLPLRDDQVAPAPVASFGGTIPLRPELAVDLSEAQGMLASPDANLVSVRSWREYIGEVSGYNYIEAKGRIPGSVFGNCGSDAYHMENFRHLDHTVREYHEVAAHLADLGIVPEAHNAFYCGTGWRGSEAFFNAWLMGWPRASVFDGGWFEWSNAGLPYEVGEPGGKS